MDKNQPVSEIRAQWSSSLSGIYFFPTERHAIAPRVSGFASFRPGIAISRVQSHYTRRAMLGGAAAMACWSNPG
ncbi:MAG: hypothetical protein ABIH03_06985 [Pseudomonadota bacterium]